MNTSQKIAENAVDSLEIKTDALTGRHYSMGSVGYDALADNGVNWEKLKTSGDFGAGGGAFLVGGAGVPVWRAEHFGTSCLSAVAPVSGPVSPIVLSVSTACGSMIWPEASVMVRIE